MSKGEVERVTDVGSVFSNNTEITSFNEFKYFTGVTHLNDATFRGCTNLQEITIPQNVVEMGWKVFTDGNCPNLHTIVILNDQSVISAQSNTLTGLTGIQNIYVPDTLVDAYKAANY